MTTSFKIPKIETDRRIRYIQEGLRKINIDALLVVQRVDLLYLAGTAQNGFLFIPTQGDPLLLIKRFAPRAREESAIPHIMEISSSKEVPERIIDFYGRLPETLAFELDVLPVTQFDFYKRLFPAKRHVDGSPLIHAARSLKSPWEIEQLKIRQIFPPEPLNTWKPICRPGIRRWNLQAFLKPLPEKSDMEGNCGCGIISPKSIHGMC